MTTESPRDAKELRRASLALVESLTPDQQQEDAVPPEFSDDALALAFAERHEQHLRYVSSWGQWREWTGTHWRQDDTLLAFDEVRAVVREAADRLARQRGNSQQVERMAATLASAKTVASVEKLAKADRRLAATTAQWDSDPLLLNTPGGMVDLRTGQMTPNAPEAYCSRSTAIAPARPGAPSPTWDRVLARVTDGDAELAGFLQRMFGYALTGSTREHALFFLYGTGRNGKGVVLNTMTRILGDYATVAAVDTFTASANDQHPTNMAMLRGARLVAAQETEEGRRWAEAKIKGLTGGDPITARFMRQDFFTFEPAFKLVIAGNHKPGLRGVDEAIRARFHLVPFTVTIPPEERDPDLAEKLKAEWPAILRWAIDGCLAWQEKGLKPPSSVLAATDAYLEAEDAFGLWLGESCQPASTGRENTADLFASWRRWAEAAGEPVGSMKRFSQTLEARGYHPKRERTGKSGFDGIRLVRPDYTEDPRYGR